MQIEVSYGCGGKAFQRIFKRDFVPMLKPHPAEDLLAYTGLQKEPYLGKTPNAPHPIPTTCSHLYTGNQKKNDACT